MGSRGRSIVWVILGIALTLSLSAYNKSISAGERGAFVLNYPATGKDAGGPSPRALTGLVVVSLDDQGIIKRTVQHDVIEVASHVVTNVGHAPLRVRFEVSGLPEDTELHSRDRAWNAHTGEIERELAPGAVVDLSMTVRLPDPLPARSIPVSGTLAVIDVASGRQLSTLPVMFQQSGFAVAGDDCCAP